MKFIVAALLGLALTLTNAHAQEPTTAPAPTPTMAPVDKPAAMTRSDATAGPAVNATPVALQQAFDGAMTCSALSALKAQETGKDESWLWGNRAFAFGMLAAQFYSNQTSKPVANEQMDEFLTTYANALAAMPAAQREPFETGCRRKYAAMDHMCESNPCPHKPPANAGAAANPQAAAPAPTPKANAPAP